MIQRFRDPSITLELLERFKAALRREARGKDRWTRAKKRAASAARAGSQAFRSDA